MEAALAEREVAGRAERDADNRRRFLRRAGRVALATPPALGLLLAAEGRHYAMAASGGTFSGGSGSGSRVSILQDEVSLFDQLATDAGELGQTRQEARFEADAIRINEEISRLEHR